jgi:hypothetical protein
MATVYRSNDHSGNFSSDDGTWVTSDGGTTHANHPVAGDTAYLTSNSGNLTIDATSACAIIDCTGYTGTLTQNANMTTTGNVTLVAGMTFTYSSGTWNFSTGTYAVASGGKSFGAIKFGTGASTITLSDDMTATGQTTFQQTGGNLTLNSNNLYMQGNIVVGDIANQLSVLGTTTLVVSGGSNQNVDFRAANSSFRFVNPVDINK